jgi:hypothetical protein
VVQGRQYAQLHGALTHHSHEHYVCDPSQLFNDAVSTARFTIRLQAVGLLQYGNCNHTISEAVLNTFCALRWSGSFTAETNAADKATSSIDITSHRRIKCCLHRLLNAGLKRFENDVSTCLRKTMSCPSFNVLPPFFTFYSFWFTGTQ